MTIAAGVRQCMKSSKTTLPQIVLVDGTFECYTSAGWKQVYGCSGNDQVFLDADRLVETQGSLWAHELTHYFGTKAENNPCGNLALEGFSIARPGAGPVHGAGSGG